MSCRNHGPIKSQSWEPLEFVLLVPSFQTRTLEGVASDGVIGHWAAVSEGKRAIWKADLQGPRESMGSPTKGTSSVICPRLTCQHRSSAPVSPPSSLTDVSRIPEKFLACDCEQLHCLTPHGALGRDKKVGMDREARRHGSPCGHCVNKAFKQNLQWENSGSLLPLTPGARFQKSHHTVLSTPSLQTGRASPQGHSPLMCLPPFPLG